MSNYEKLAGMVNAGDINLISIIAVPRSVSTALCRALSNSNTLSIGINEPFNRTCYDIEDASRRTLEAIEGAPQPECGPLTVVTKNMARNISRPILNELMGISKEIVWAVREPERQISSLITRIANNKYFGSGSNVLSVDDLTDEHIRVAVDFLESGPRAVNFAKTNWVSIDDHYKTVSAERESLVVDGTALTSDPENVLRSAAKALGLTFSPRMVQGWQATFVNTNTGYNPNLADDQDAWTKDAITSRGIHPSQDKIIDMDRLPPSLQEHISEIAIPVYERMICVQQ